MPASDRFFLDTNPRLHAIGMFRVFLLRFSM
jgi:hypothetical protein